MSRLKIDFERCMGHGRCYSLLPNLFDTDEFGHGVLLPASEIDANEARLAVQSCPEGAITFEP